MTTTPHLTPQISARAVKASSTTETNRVANAVRAVMATFEAIASAKPDTLASVLAKRHVSVSKVTCDFWGPRDSLIKASGFEYRLNNWHSGDPLESGDLRKITNELESKLEKLSSGFSRIQVSERDGQLAVTLVKDKVPDHFRMDA